MIEFRPLIVRLRATLWHMRKWWRVHARRRRKFYRLFLTQESFESAKSNPEFVLGLHLLRFASRLRCYHRLYLRIPDDGALSNTNDRVHVALLIGTTIYESLEEFRTLQNEIRGLNSFQSVAKTVKRLNRTISGKQSDLRPVLAALRNKVMYHFDRETMTEALAQAPLRRKLDVVIGETPRNADVVFPLVEDSLLSYVISRDTGSGNDMQKYDKLQKDVLTVGEELIHVCYGLALELLHPWIRRERSQLFLKRSEKS